MNQLSLKYFSKVIVCISALLFFFSSCTDINTRKKHNFSSNEGLKILCTTEMISDLVEPIIQEHAEIITLIRGDIDPHSYEIVKGDNEKLEQADLIFYNGLDLEHGASLKSYLEGSQKAHALGDYIQKNHPEDILFFQGSIDPHIWMDISLWQKGVDLITSVLQSKLHHLSQKIEQRALFLKEKMQISHQAVYATLQKVSDQKRYLVTSHDAFNYFAKAYLATEKERQENTWDPRFEAPEGLAPESQLSVLDIQEIINHLIQYQIHVIFPESNVSQDSIRKIIDATDQMGFKVEIAEDVLYGDAIGEADSQADTYLKMMEYNAKTIAKYLAK